MVFVAIDGDDIGRRLAACYLSNQVDALKATKDLVELKTQRISGLLSSLGFEILFCAADGVTGSTRKSVVDDSSLYQRIKEAVGDEISFSVGVGGSLREAYVALLYARVWAH